MKNPKYSYRKLMAEIQCQKQKLERRAKEHGLYENFGQKEVRQLRDKFVDVSDYNTEMKNIRQAINRFDAWCMNFTVCRS